jgi:hypothetical protein
MINVPRLAAEFSPGSFELIAGITTLLSTTNEAAVMLLDGI